MGATGEITGLLNAASGGDPEAMKRLRQDHTLQATALVNEVYLEFVDQRRARYQDRLHFYRVAAGIMRRILTDHSRAVGRIKRGGRLGENVAR
jgi:ECF sigma factor